MAAVVGRGGRAVHPRPLLGAARGQRRDRPGVRGVLLPALASPTGMSKSTISVRVRAGASRDEVVGPLDGVLVVRVAAPAARDVQIAHSVACWPIAWPSPRRAW